eukprot:TRINITY_DN13174_c0_g1_i1.p1 TRINITY_DN13174_c0_g1~~TRINITY_DN13174_c0_g1_i1.p1  ORF type:complete len:290 (+),score=105.30 TRINITY_DN13174_c0_g1_i1:50-919(+)
MGGDKSNVREYMLAGGGAAIVSRTAIAPVERVKIIFQTSPEMKGYGAVFQQVWKNEGALSFWKGNGVAVVRVVPYLSVQLSCNDVYKQYVGQVIHDKNIRNVVAGVAAGATSIATTYPLDTVRARLAVQMSKGEATESILGMAKRIASTEGIPAFYRGCYMSCFGGGVYAGIKFATYDYLKGAYCGLMDIKEKEMNVLQRAVSGAVGGFIAQTFIYPMDVIRRRMQISKGPPPYTGIVNGIMTITRTEGLKNGLFRGLSLNYMKTVPNVALYLSLYDVFKHYLVQWSSA